MNLTNLEILNKIKEIYRDEEFVNIKWTDLFYLKKGVWVSSNIDDIAKIAEFLKINENSYIVDLGSGDGRVCFVFSLFGAKIDGIEYNLSFINLSNRIKKHLASYFDTSKVNFIHKDFLDHNLSKYDILFYFISGSFDERNLKLKLLKEMKNKAKLIVYGRSIPTIKKKFSEFKEIKIPKSISYFCRIYYK